MERTPSNPVSEVILTKNSSDYSSVLRSSIRNYRFLNTSIVKPQFIITPFDESHIEAAIVCAKEYGMQIRVRSGGHDYEGLSFESYQEFVLVDLAKLSSITVDIENEMARVGAGASIGELYYKIADKSRVHGFPAGSCPTVGVGGHFSGGGFGTIFREYGLAADNVIDAQIVDANGRILDRESMGEDLFWAIRGGGAASFGQGASNLLQKWQSIGHKFHEDLFLNAAIEVATSSSNGNKTIRVSFVSLFLGRAEELLPVMQDSFPELGLMRENRSEMSWIQSVLYFGGFSPSDSLDVLLSRTAQFKGFFKGKSDYLKEPISETGLEGLYRRLLEEEASMLILTPYGGRMSEMSDSEIPFPHRSGNIFKIQYLITWDVEEETERHLKWMRRLYAYMAPYVSNSPRAAYLNYRDLDLGSNNNGNTSFAKASVWGLKYFKNNFKRLVQVKTATDPSNFFRNEQSIPVLPSRGYRRLNLK
ncbi:hypothetical protein POTOM_040225 [Populus tomentosa]|uniref:FAD-binding PCMH-type domain-containing protein n=1 Tax=Populus tomentosa TaxID=118781 RepID=A0A8X7YWQ4_POPTO|nr:hypothetical protein POTOM_040225 [Populus tomentosa]